MPVMHLWLKFKAQCDYEIMKKHHQDHLLLDIFIGWHYFSFEEYELHNREDFESQEEILKWTVLLDSAEKHTWVGKLVWRLRISSIVFEIDWKRNDLKYDTFGELNWSGMYYMCDLSMVYEVHEYIPLQSNSPYRSGLTKGMPLSKHVLEILARYTSLPTQVCVFCKIVLNQAKIYI